MSNYSICPLENITGVCRNAKIMLFSMMNPLKKIYIGINIFWKSKVSEKAEGVKKKITLITLFRTAKCVRTIYDPQAID